MNQCMRDLDIDPDFEVAADFSEESVERMADDFVMFGNDWLNDYITDEASYDKVHDIIKDCINSLAEDNRHINGEVYIFDWNVFDVDLRLRVKSILSRSKPLNC